MNDARQRKFRLNGQLLDVNVNRINGNAVEPKHVEVLLTLAQSAPEPVSTADLIDTVWKDVVVGDNVVHQAVARLRRTLGDDARRPRFIETVPRRGYRLIPKLIPELGLELDAPPGARVRFAASGRMAVAALLLAGIALTVGFHTLADKTTPVQRTVAVLELSDVSPNAALGWLAEGISMELRRQIDHIEGFDTLPRAIAYRSTALELKSQAQLLLDGMIEAQGTNVKVTLELSDLEKEILLWRERFSGPNDDARDLQTRIATGIVRYFDTSLRGIAGPSDGRAYEAYLRHLHQQWGGNPDQELHWLRTALAEDPSWSDGWGELAWHLHRQAAWRRDWEYVEQAEDALAKQRELTGDPGYGWNVEAVFKAYWYGDMASAERVLREGQRAHEYAHLLLSSGLCRQAADLGERDAQHKPYDVGAWDYLAMARACLGDADGAVAAAQHAMQLMPADAFLGNLGLVWGLPRLGRLQEAQALLERWESQARSSEADTMNGRLLERYQQILRFEIADAEQDIATASAAAQWFADQGDHFRAGIAFLRLGDPRARLHLQSATAPPYFVRPIWAWHVPFIPAELRDDPDIVALQTAMGFSPAWRAELCQLAAGFPTEPPLHCPAAD